MAPVLDYGACDRLRRLTFLVTVARLKGLRSVQLNEVITDSCPFALMEFISLAGMDVRPWKGDANPPQLQLDDQCPYPDLGTVERNLPGELGVAPPEFLEEWLATYASIRPSAEVQRAVTAAGVTRETLGVHVRRTDKVRAMPGRHERTVQEQRREEAQMERMTRERLARGGIRNAYVASDSAAGKEDWTGRLAALGLPVIAHGSQYTEGRRRHTGGLDFFVDLFALSQCGAMVVTRMSGVGLAARYIGGVNDVSRARRPREPEAVRQLRLRVLALARRLRVHTFGGR
ncbi:MAG: hypothetical protein JWO05_714 [Gemmatimonadetes bacterium]|nr:hypothetical protein [Gemmatimonadota bacterium]